MDVCHQIRIKSPPQMARFLLVLCGLFVAAVIKWLFDHLLYDWLARTIESQFGVSEADLIATVSSFVFPVLIAGGAIVVAYRPGVHQGTGSTAPHSGATAPPSTMMLITDIAAHLRDISEWGWRKRKELTLINFVQDEVPDELRRAARGGEVRFVGTRPDHDISEEIDLGYWDAATFDSNALWNSQYEVFTMARLAADYDRITLLRFGRAPREDVMITWPPASHLLRLYVKTLVWLRWARHGFSVASKAD